MFVKRLVFGTGEENDVTFAARIVHQSSFEVGPPEVYDPSPIVPEIVVPNPELFFLGGPGLVVSVPWLDLPDLGLVCGVPKFHRAPSIVLMVRLWMSKLG